MLVDYNFIDLITTKTPFNLSDMKGLSLGFGLGLGLGLDLV